MPVPSTIDDLSTTAASNSPSGSDQRSQADDYLRAHAAIIKQLEADLDSGGQQVGFTHTGTGAQSETVQTSLRRWVWGEQFGMVGDASTANATALQNAITKLRGNSVTLTTDGLGSGSFTAYSSGVLYLGPGIFKVAAATISLTQDLGLTIRGQGSRRTNNSVRAATTILITGTSSSYGIQAKGNGARGFTLEDLDLCYETSNFTGYPLDIYSCPGVTLNRVFIGTYGITGGTRLQTAAACIRATYDEFFHANDCVFDGAVDGFWSDDTREPSGGFSAFGGSQTLLTNCVFYDFTGDMLRHDGNRTRTGFDVVECSFNPISVDCDRCVDLNNVEGLRLKATFTPSVANKATTEWMRLVNCTGSIEGCLFDDLSKAGTIDGNLSITGNRIAATDGFTLEGGVITGSGNEFSDGTAGYTIATPNYQLTVDLGPDLFKAAVGNSYVMGASQTSAKGRVTYDADQDASSGYTNSNPRITVVNGDEETVSRNADFTTTALMSGRTQELTKTGSTQAVTLHAPTGGREILRFFKTTTQTVTITCAGGDNFYTGETSATTVATGTNTAVGAYLELESYGAAGWKVISRSTGWTFS